jgi:hypothetical protein
MNVGLINKLSMFLSSYLLMFLALALKTKWNSLFLGLFFISIIGTIGTYFILKTEINPEEIKIQTIEQRNDQVINYLVTYLLPFLGLNLETVYDQFAIGILMLTICVLYIKADLIYINPTLMLFGYNIYSVTLDNSAMRILITKRTLNDLRLSRKIKIFELQDRSIIIENQRGDRP